MSNKLRVVIVEDEEPAIRELKFILGQTGEIEVIGCAAEGNEALKIIGEQNPDAVFLDIHIPGVDGISVAENLRANGSKSIIIFATAYDEYTIKAFELNALDYILKPYNEDRILSTVERIKERRENRGDILERISKMLHSYDINSENKKEFTKIPCEHYEKTIFIDRNDIVYCTTEADQVYINTSSKRYLTHYTLTELEDKGNLVRVHRSYLVNLNKIKELYSWFHGTYKIVMQDEEKTEIPVSRNNIKRLKNILGL